MNRVTGRASLQTGRNMFEPLEGRLLLAATLIRDIIDESNGGGARLYPDPNGDSAYLFTSTTEKARVYRTDGTKQGTVRLQNVPDNVTPINVNGKLIYFHNKALWKAGAKPNKSPVKLRNFAAFTFNLIEAGDKAFFTVRREVDTSTGTNVTDYLWTTDGTKAGTRRVETADGKPLYLPHHTLAEFDDQLYLAARTNASGSDGLWKTDGTPKNTKLVFAHENPALGLIWDLVPAGDRLYFPYEKGFWSTDGTTKGTVRLADDPIGIFPAADRPYFIPRGNGNEQQNELWTTDGTAAGTRHVTDLRGQYDHSHWQSAFVEDRFFFNEGRGTRSDLRVTNGTTKGTRLLADAGEVIPDSGGNPIGSLIADDDQLYFSRWTPETGRELWTTTGTPKSTRRVKEIGPGAENGFIGRVGVLDDTLFFLAKLDGAIDLWTTNGASGGTRRFIKLRQPTVGTAFDHTTPLDNGRFVFAADHPQTTAFFDGLAGQLWGSDATGPGTRLLADVASRIQEIEPAGSRAFVNASYHDSEGGTLWVTDGTPAGTRKFFEDSEDWIGDLTVLDGVAYFSRGSGELWTSDGTSGGTRLLKDTPADALSEFGRIGDRLYFTAYKGGPDLSNSDLWVTDGTADGTRLVKSKVTHLMNNLRFDHLDASTFTAGDQLFMFTFMADQEPGRELWVTDGTESGTRRLATFPDAGLTSITGAAVLDGQFLFAIRDEKDRTYLWSSDGTPKGTVRLRKITSAGAFALQFTVFEDALYFIGQSKSRGYDLWRSDGTAEGTRPFLDINPGPASAWPGNFSLTDLIAVGDLLVFNADDGVHGEEIWVSDGTRAGTRRVTDIAANNAWSAPSEFVIFGDRLIFTADDGTRGRELWQMPLSDLR